MKLYYVPLTRSTRPRWVLEELGVPYELVRLDPKNGETRTPEHTRRHPLQHVPVLEDGALTLFESVAICLYLAEKHPERGLLPPAGSIERALCYQWLSYAMTELEPPTMQVFYERRKDEASRNPAVMEAGKAKAHKAATPLEERFENNVYMLGETFSVADVVVGSLLALGRRLQLLEGFPRIDAYVNRLMERPAAKRAFGD